MVLRVLSNVCSINSAWDRVLSAVCSMICLFYRHSLYDLDVDVAHLQWRYKCVPYKCFPLPPPCSHKCEFYKRFCANIHMIYEPVLHSMAARMLISSVVRYHLDSSNGRLSFQAYQMADCLPACIINISVSSVARNVLYANTNIA